MTDIQYVQVLIAGAGPSGLTLACDLARRGIKCRVIDREAIPFTGSRAKGLMPRTLEVFGDLGVIDRVLQAGGPFPPFRGYAGNTVLWDRDIYTMAGFPRLESTAAIPYPDFWMLPQYRTAEILANRFRELGGRVELSTELISFDQDQTGVTATLVHAGRTEIVRADYLVGADGGRSFVRKNAGVAFVGEADESDRSIIADVRADGPDREHWHMWTNPTVPAQRVSLCPLPGTDMFQFVAPVPDDVIPELHIGALQELFNERSGRTDIRLFDLSWATLYRVNIRLAERFQIGRIVLVGDAAHVHSPAGGQGMNTGIQDAYNLGWKLGAVLCGAPDALLETYEEERLPVAASVLGFTTKLHRTGFQTDAPPEKQSGQDVTQLALNYRGSSLSRHPLSRSDRIQAGDRAPDALCEDLYGQQFRLFDLFRGPYFVLLVFSESNSAFVASVNDRCLKHVRAYQIVSAISQIEFQETLVDDDGSVYRAYDVHGDMCILVRPDGYIGFMTNDRFLETLDEYLMTHLGR